MIKAEEDAEAEIHRHTGGLEMIKSMLQSMEIIHRHTGGLTKEMSFFDLPPHRRINKGDELFLIHRHTGLETETSSTSFGTKYTAKQVD
ncbi:hypothetical protein THERMOT_1738 [Bathymodiolus thermophilus thioautotrophic gill symbiont]|nr:hypothetical protein THERMOT_1738 [Bathymodiolus thermophilus thioautotrophic gill symbiont]